MNQIIFEITQELNAAYGLEWNEEIKRLFAETVIMECLRIPAGRDELTRLEFARAVEDKLKEKNA